MTVAVAVVTGAARGLGRAVANRLSALGHHVVVTDIDFQGAQETAGALPSATALALDVRDPAAHWAVAEQAARIGRVSVWVNNAGVLATGLPWEQDDETVAQVIDVNVRGVVHGCRAAVATMAASTEPGTCDIVNVASIAAFGPVPGGAVYAATKAAVTGFTMSLAGDLRWTGLDQRIRVHAYCPGAADTQMIRSVAEDPYSAVLQSAPKLLPPDKIADGIVKMIGGRGVIRSRPRGRAAFLRAASLVPGPSLLLLPYFRTMGERRRQRVLDPGDPE